MHHIQPSKVEMRYSSDLGNEVYYLHCRTAIYCEVACLLVILALVHEAQMKVMPLAGIATGCFGMSAIHSVSYGFAYSSRKYPGPTFATHPFTLDDSHHRAFQRLRLCRCLSYEPEPEAIYDEFERIGRTNVDRIDFAGVE
ncbi:hypothetical protein HGRIS_012913 [Hohenbuehelia grisea]|uniref:Uncharacterized protein n=1 Tax=Hohenbuehelia grisea TaxID=104357 RepID=A0ABR3IU30_9AGAR